jgi:hypothetical protein
MNVGDEERPRRIATGGLQPGEMNVGDEERPRRIATGGLEVAEPGVIDQACPWERVLYCYFSAPGVLCLSF